MHLQQIGLADVHILAQPRQLVGLGHQAVEDFAGHRHQIWMRHPGAVMAITGFALLVGAHAGQRRVIRSGITTIGNLRGHAPHGEGTPAVAGLDQQQ